MTTDSLPIQHVSDTALWVAYFRGLESKSPQPLFTDALALRLVGERGERIARSMKATSRYTRWSVVVRTWVIDHYLKTLLTEGVDTVVNLGAGLDTRPYRLALPLNLRWIEVDYPQIIAHKDSILKNEKPNVQLERISLDLSDREKRCLLFAKINSESQKVLVLTEGVIPYLTEEQVGTLAEDLREQKSFAFWIAEYFSPEIYQYFQKSDRMKKLKNAPFQFFPAQWFDFFEKHGWKLKEVRYLSEEGAQLGRPFPYPWWAVFFIPFMSEEKKNGIRRQMGYVIFTPEN